MRCEECIKLHTRVTPRTAVPGSLFNKTFTHHSSITTRAQAHKQSGGGVSPPPRPLRPSVDLIAHTSTHFLPLHLSLPHCVHQNMGEELGNYVHQINFRSCIDFEYRNSVDQEPTDSFTFTRVLVFRDTVGIHACPLRLKLQQLHTKSLVLERYLGGAFDSP